MISLMTTELKQRLKEARKAKKLTQKDVASHVGMTQPSYSELETGRSTSSSYLPQIAKLLSVDSHWLATGEGDQEIKASSDASSSEQRQIPVPARSAIKDWVKSDKLPSGTHHEPAPSTPLGPNAYIVEIDDDSLGMMAPARNKLAIDPGVSPQKGDIAVFQEEEWKAPAIGVYMERPDGARSLKFLDGSKPIELSESANYLGRAAVILQKIL